jgi:hypothetical protein
LRQRRRLLCSMVMLTAACFGQTAPNERPFAASKAEVDSALRSLQAAAGGRLPTLEGFIAEQSLPLDHLQRPHYTYSLDVLPRPSGSLVRVRAHITAWFAGPTAGHSGYRELASNGRLETDLFERLEDWLGQKSGGPPAANVQTTSAKTAPNPLFAVPRPGAVSLPSRSTADSSTSDSSTPSAKSGDHDSAGYAQALREQAKNLEDVLRNQTQPTDLAAVRKPKTPVYSRPSEQGEVLFLADAQDEFQMLNTNSEWVHVQISGLSRGWIRGQDLELPSRAATSSVPVAPLTASPAASATRPTTAVATDPPFRLARQEVNTYPGDWAPLRGKPVRILSLSPTGTAPTSSREKWDTARAMFQRAAARLPAPESASRAPVEGVVLIFDSADGGMASATVTTLREWDNGRLSDDAFREQCSFDPPEAFRK